MHFNRKHRWYQQHENKNIIWNSGNEHVFTHLCLPKCQVSYTVITGRKTMIEFSHSPPSLTPLLQTLFFSLNQHHVSAQQSSTSLQVFHFRGCFTCQRLDWKIWPLFSVETGKLDFVHGGLKFQIWGWTWFNFGMK